MSEANGIATSFSNGKKIRFSQHITINSEGHLHISQDAETPERVKELQEIVTHGIQVAPVATGELKRGGWPKGKSRAKKVARRRK